MANSELIRDVVEHIDRKTAVDHTLRFDMSEWYMSEWYDANSCKTSMCFAGWAAHYAGKKIVEITTDGITDTYIEGEGKTIGTWAGEYLDLTPIEADCIFYSDACDTIELRQIIEEAIGKEIF